MPERYLPELRRELLTAAAAQAAPRHAPGRTPGRRSRVLAGTLVAACASASLAFMLGAGSDPQATANDVRADGVLLRAQFAVFGKDSDAQLPGNPFTAERMGRSEMQAPSVHRLSVPQADVWVGADERQICLSAAIEGSNAARGSCARPAQVADSGLYVLGREAPTGDAVADARTAVAGLVPDGVATVTFHFRDGTPVSAPVVGNGVATSLTEFPVRATFQDEQGEEHGVDL